MKKITSFDWWVVLLVAILFAPVCIAIVSLVDAHSTTPPVNRALAQKVYEKAMKEYDWEVFKETHEQEFSDAVQTLIRRFPRVCVFADYENALMDIWRKRFMEKGTVSPADTVALLDSLYEVVFSPKKGVCRQCGFTEGPTIKDFIFHTEAPRYNDAGCIVFPFKVTGQGLYAGEMILKAADLIEVRAGHNCRGRECRHWAVIDYSFDQTPAEAETR